VSAGLRIWIDAASAASETRVFGLTLLDHLLHALIRSQLELAEVHVERPSGAPADLDPALARALPLRWCDPGGVGFAARVGRALDAASGAPLLLLGADAMLDPRLLRCFAALRGNRAFRSPVGTERAALLRLEGPLSSAAAGAQNLAMLAQQLVNAGAAAAIAPGEFDTYLVDLRRHVDPYLFPIASDAERERVERFLFDSNYKGSTDFLTKWVYPPLVWRIVRLLAARHVHPNSVTWISIASTIAAIPFFAAGDWVVGSALAYAMSVLDSVDGKLARLTYTYSNLGTVLDHGLDLVHPPFWYLAWGYALGGGSSESAPFITSVWLFAVYFVDRALAGIFKWRTGVSIHGATPLDERMRTVISRRNPNLAYMTVALLLDWLVPGLEAALFTFYAIVAWQVACLFFHAERVIQYWGTKLRPIKT
jgi:phosphatidylglycerophosphate synthase